MSKHIAIKNRIAALISEIDPNEMACRILEGAMGLKRPSGTTALQALSSLDEEARLGMYKAAENAAKYMVECINDGVKPS